MIPAEVTTRVAKNRPFVEQLVNFLIDRLNADLAGLGVVSIQGRAKSPASVFQKLQTGKYSGIDELSDLAALTIVVLTRGQISVVLDAVKTSGLKVVDEPVAELRPTDLRYHEPKLLLKAPTPFTDRHPELADLVAEVQFTTTLQHALDMSTHDFDYKGKTYSWRNFRLVAQLRGTLELVDALIDDIQNVQVGTSDESIVPQEFSIASKILDILTARFDASLLPNDRRRLADTVSAWAKALELDPDGLGGLLEKHSDLTESLSLDPASAVLGALLREDADKFIVNYPLRIPISGELESLVPEARGVPGERRVVLT